jgi:hypothetical protein
MKLLLKLKIMLNKAIKAILKHTYPENSKGNDLFK